MDVTVQLAVQVEVALILERRATSGALEAISVQVLVLDAHKHTTWVVVLGLSWWRGDVRIWVGFWSCGWVVCHENNHKFNTVF